MPAVLFERRSGHLGVITLNDSANLNAMGEGMADEFSDLIATLKGDPSPPRALILTGAGRAFSAGGDLEMLRRKSDLSLEENRIRMERFYNSFLSILSLGVPVIAAINGHAVGAGLCLACACDIRIAAPEAKLGFTFVKLGLHPGMGATYFLPRVLGARATELLVTGRIITAPESLEIGMVSEVVAAPVLDRAVAIAQEILGCGPQSVRSILSALRGDPKCLQDALAKEAIAQAHSYASAEFKEGVLAAIEKRAPNFG